MATVITNLLSAIPYFGQDLVELNSYTNYIYQTTIVTSALSELPTIGTIHKNSLKKGKKIRLDKKEYLLIPSQFIAFLVGFIDGDGYIQITETTKGFIAIKLVLLLQLKDLSTLEYIQSVLNLGKISISKDQMNPKCKLILNRTDLQDVIFPLLVHHNIFFLTKTRRDQFNLAMFIFKQDIKHFKIISKLNKEDIPVLYETPKKAHDYLKLLFFNNWLVGFTTAEGSFFIKSNNDGCFQLKQRIHEELFESFRLLFETNRKIDTDKSLYNQFSVSSKKDIQSVINFFSFSGLHPLTGSRLIEYLRWLNAIDSMDNNKRVAYTPAPTSDISPRCSSLQGVIEAHQEIDKTQDDMYTHNTIIHTVGGGLSSNEILIFCIISIVYLIFARLTIMDSETFLNCIYMTLTPIVLYDNADKEKAIAIKCNRRK